MVETHIVNLTNIPGGASITFRSVEIPIGEGLYSPFVLVHYSINNELQEYGLRIDVDKQVFLDHFYEDQDKEEILLKAAPKIIAFLDPILEDLYKQDEDMD
jgi:hypothetical protein